MTIGGSRPWYSETAVTEMAKRPKGLARRTDAVISISALSVSSSEQSSGSRLPFAGEKALISRCAIYHPPILLPGFPKRGSDPREIHLHTTHAVVSLHSHAGRQMPLAPVSRSGSFGALDPSVTCRERIRARPREGWFMNRFGPLPASDIQTNLAEQGQVSKGVSGIASEGALRAEVDMLASGY